MRLVSLSTEDRRASAIFVIEKLRTALFAISIELPM